MATPQPQQLIKFDVCLYKSDDISFEDFVKWLRSLDDLQRLTMGPGWAELEKEAALRSNMELGHLVVGFETVQIHSDEARGTPAAA
ncbi:hypothetical protein B0T17DRAFT_614008 [Bombardia bombarda]|uniref:Uncharacterized protein n=1 Tax=Bombardia bombarda TaxID=252184 RepID=A0AA39XNQ4_9PEZI|nr:hypothetical protein B0T17DRAFT_614008 [Bombardia bombarda]